MALNSNSDLISGSVPMLLLSSPCELRPATCSFEALITGKADSRARCKCFASTRGVVQALNVVAPNA